MLETEGKKMYLIKRKKLKSLFKTGRGSKVVSVEGMTFVQKYEYIVIYFHLVQVRFGRTQNLLTGHENY